MLTSSDGRNTLECITDQQPLIYDAGNLTLLIISSDVVEARAMALNRCGNISE